MAKLGNDRDMEATERPAHDPARPVSSMSDMPYFSEALSINPLLAHPAAAMAAATAIGLGFANQMASAFFGAMQDALETANRQKAAQEVEAVVPKAEAPVVAEPVKAPEPVQAPKAKAVRKAAPPKKVVAKAVPVEAPAKAKAALKVAAKVEPKAVAKPKTSVSAATGVGDGDLKKISGIGPKLEGLLKGMGVTTVAQIAAWTDKDIARFDKELGFEGRIVRDDWVGQAKALLK